MDDIFNIYTRLNNKGTSCLIDFNNEFNSHRTTELDQNIKIRPCDIGLLDKALMRPCQ